MARWGLAIDIGGTNVRLALVDQDSGQIMELKRYLCSEFGTLQEVIAKFLESKSTEVEQACIAVAAPVGQDEIKLTNNPWQFSVSRLQSDLQLKNLLVINDYQAIAMAVPHLNHDQMVKIGRGEPVQRGTMVICGPGTGLGVALLSWQEEQPFCLSGEGGHVDFAPQSDLEDFLLRDFRKRYAHVSAERFISGQGLVNLYQGVKRYYQEPIETLTPSEISAKAIQGKDLRCKEVLDLFCQLLGAFSGNLAITSGAFGGVFIAGGIAPKMTDFIETSGFRERFEAKGRFSRMMESIPTYILTELEPGVIGAARYLLQKTS